MNTILNPKINNDVVDIKISSEDYDLIANIIDICKKKYQKDLEIIKKSEENSIIYDYEINKQTTLQQIKIIKELIKDVLSYFKTRLINLKYVFLACSYGRQTNKFESDLDLHFIYKKENYDMAVEEMICYIITSILDKPRDIIDPKFIINFDKKNKKDIESYMSNKDLIINLKSKKGTYSYKYNYLKKKKFFLQYLTIKTENNLKKYILNEGIKEENMPWAHSYLIIYNEKEFNIFYNDIYIKEKNLINNIYKNSQIEKTISELNKIQLNLHPKTINDIKKQYQSIVFTVFFRYLNMIRITKIYHNYDVKYLKIYDLHDISSNKEQKNIEKILEYIYNIKSISVLCREKNILYSLHNNSQVNLNLEKLIIKFDAIKQLITKDLLEKIKED